MGHVFCSCMFISLWRETEILTKERTQQFQFFVHACSWPVKRNRDFVVFCSCMFISLWRETQILTKERTQQFQFFVHACSWPVKRNRDSHKRKNTTISDPTCPLPPLLHQNEPLTLHTLTSECIFSTLFSSYFPIPYGACFFFSMFISCY